MRAFVRRLCRDQRGVTLVEYSLIACLIATAAIGALVRVGQTAANVLGIVANTLN
jgi:Flp pilus assembly pilin Flp